MGKNKKTLNSLKDFEIEYYKENPEEEKHKILIAYGINIPKEELKNIEIIERTKHKLTFLNKKTNEIITSDLMRNIYQKKNKIYSVLLSTRNKDNSFVIDHFHIIHQSHNPEQAGKNALESRKYFERKLLSRAYQNVKTKYGDFCLHIEEGYSEAPFGPYRQVSLYHGNHEQVLDQNTNDFDYSNKCLFRWSYYDRGNFNQCIMGFNKDDAIHNPKNNIWRFDNSIYNGRLVKTPTYAFDAPKASGIIIKNGLIKILDNRRTLPHRMSQNNIRRQLEEYENKDYKSKAYFVNFGECFVILKNNSTMTIEYKKKDFETKEWKKVFTEEIPSKTNERFTHDDFKRIISLLDTLEISEKLQKELKTQLTGYINTHDETNNEIIYSLKPYHFKTMLNTMRQQDIKKTIEEGLEILSNLFKLPVEEIVGLPPKENNYEYIKSNK